MKQISAVEWLYHHLFPKQLDGFSEEEWSKIDKAFDQAKQMENEQQIELLKFSREMCTPDAPIDYVLNEFNKYHNKTSNTKDCQFYPKMDTTSATICANCGREKFEHNL